MEQKDDLRVGKIPRVHREGLTVQEFCNQFLNSKRHLRDTGEITRRTFQNYYRACDRLISQFGKSRLVDDLAVDDFERLRKHLTKTRGPVAYLDEDGDLMAEVSKGEDVPEDWTVVESCRLRSPDTELVLTDAA